MITTEIENKVESDILELAQLPPEGIVAGQFVASLFYKHLGLPLKQPLNDIDIFVDNQVETATNDVFRTFRHSHRITSKTPSKFKDGLKSAFFRGYSIIKSYMSDNDKSDIPINFVVTSPTYFIEQDSFLSLIKKDHILSRKIEQEAQEKKRKLNPEMIINNFDLNCCAVAYNIETRTFHYTDAFLQFIKDFKLRITSAHAPHSTLLRLNKKIKDLDCNPDIEDEKNFILLYGSILPSYSKLNTTRFKYGKRFLKLYNDNITDELNNIFYFDRDSFVEIKKINFESGDKEFKKLNAIYNNLSFLKQLDKSWITVNVALNLYYIEIGVLKNKDNLEHLKSLQIVNAQDPLSKNYKSSLSENYNSSLSTQWFFKNIAWKPFGEYSIKEIEKEIPVSLKLEKDAHLVFSLIGHFETPNEMENFAKYFLNENGDYDRVKGELFKFHNKALYDLENAVFNIDKYKPKRAFPFIYKIETIEQALYLDASHNFSLQRLFLNNQYKGIFCFSLFNKAIVPFILIDPIEKSSVSVHYFGRQIFSPRLHWKNLQFVDLFNNIRFIDGNDEIEGRKTEDLKRNFKYLIMFCIAMAFYLTPFEEEDKNIRKEKFKKRWGIVLTNIRRNITKNKRTALVRPTLVISKIREIFKI